MCGKSPDVLRLYEKAVVSLKLGSALTLHPGYTMKEADKGTVSLSRAGTDARACDTPWAFWEA